MKIVYLAALAACRCRPTRRSSILACEPEWGALAKELGGEQGERLHGDHARCRIRITSRRGRA